MISLETLVFYVLYMLVAGIVIGLLFWLISYVEAQGIGPAVVYKIIRIVFVALIVVVLCLFLISLSTGRPVFRAATPIAAAIAFSS